VVGIGRVVCDFDGIMKTRGSQPEEKRSHLVLYCMAKFNGNVQRCGSELVAIR
jgi:hypothetical protein